MKNKGFKASFAAMLAGLSISAMTGCVTLGPPPPSDTFPKSFAEAPAPQTLPPGVKVDFKDAFKTDNLDDTLEAANRVFIPGFRVAFAVSNKARASVTGGRTLGGGVSSGAKVEMTVVLDGVTLDDMQKITDAAYADFVAQMKAAGREIVPIEQMRAAVAYKAIDFYTGKLPYGIQPSAVKNETRDLVLLTPTGLPLWFSNFDPQLGDRGLFDQRNAKALNSLSAELKAVAVIPTIVVDFMKMSSSGRSTGFLGGGEASVEAESMVHLSSVVANTIAGANMSLGKDAMNVQWGYFQQKEAIDAAGTFGELKELDASRHEGFAGFAGSTALSVGSASKSTQALVADPARYSELSLKAIQGFNGAFVQAANKFKAKK